MSIKLFRAQQTIAAQTNFVKLSLVQISLFNFGLRKLIFVGEVKGQSRKRAN